MQSKKTWRHAHEDVMEYKVRLPSGALCPGLGTVYAVMPECPCLDQYNNHWTGMSTATVLDQHDGEGECSPKA